MAGQTEETLTDKVSLPRPPVTPPHSRNPLSIWEWLSRALVGFLSNLLRAVEDDLGRIHRIVNGMMSKGPNIEPVAGVLTITGRIHCVTGSSDIQTIAASPGFAGWCYLVSIGGGWELVTGGNIAAAAHPEDGESIALVFDVATGLWHPTIASGGGGSVPYRVRGWVALEGTKDGVNKDFTLPGGDQFYLDVHGNTFGILFVDANPLSPTSVAPVVDAFEYQRTSLTAVTLGIAPASTSVVAFYNLLVAP